MIRNIKLTLISSLVLLVVINNSSGQDGLFAQHSWALGQQYRESSRKNSGETRQITFRYQNSEKVSDSDLESVLISIQSLGGVKYVGVDYTKREITVRYLKSQALLNDMTKIISRSNVGLVDTVSTTGTLDRHSNDIRFECLHFKDAESICQKHFKNILADDFDYQNCYTVQVEIRLNTDISDAYDLHSQTCVIDAKGKAIKPIAWLAFPESDKKPSKLSGVLIFPKVPLLGGGLTLRLLKANGEGYDSYTIDVPNR